MSERRIQITNDLVVASIIPSHWESWQRDGYRLVDPSARDDSLATLDTDDATPQANEE